MTHSFAAIALLAQDGGEAPAEAPPSILPGMLMIFMPILVLWYFLVIMPQNKERTQRQSMLNSLKKNDTVVTIGGIIGQVVSVTENGAEVTIRVDDNARLRLRRDAIREVLSKEEKAKSDAT
jgi:preprotein translocase subunit YajC